MLQQSGTGSGHGLFVSEPLKMVLCHFAGYAMTLCACQVSVGTMRGQDDRFDDDACSAMRAAFACAKGFAVCSRQADKWSSPRRSLVP